MILGIDLDGTLAKSLEDILTAKQKEKFRKLYNWVRIHQPKSLQGKIMTFILSHYFNYKWKNWKSIKLADNNIPSILANLIKTHNINIITSSYGKEEYIKNWLAKNNISYTNLIFASPIEKWKYCDILIDDRFDVIMAAVLNGKVGILYTKSNYKLNYKNYYVAKTWNEINDIIKNF
ncbi:MAG: hypothetical protein QXL51_04460 [Candidatus Aenigmatarchaeota archaeon]